MKKLTFDSFAKIIEDVGDHTVDAVKLGMQRVNLRIRNTAAMRAPYITGALRRSGWSTASSITFTAWYAANVHENPRSEGYKFLESAIKEASTTYAEDVAKAAAPDWTPDKPKRLPLRDFTEGDFDG